MQTPLIRDQFELIAYRGGAKERPENTIEAFEHTASVSSEIIFDLDLQFAKDHTVVVFHDETLERTTDGSGRISDHTISELSALDAGFHFEDESGKATYRDQDVRIPTLETVLDRFRESRFILDIRTADPTHISSVIGVVERHEASDHVVIVSEIDRILEACRAVHPEWCYGAPTNEVRMVLSGSQPPGSSIFMIPETLGGMQILTKTVLELLQAAGKKVWIWTIDESDDLRRLREMGVDGVFTNCPKQLSNI